MIAQQVKVFVLAVFARFRLEAEDIVEDAPPNHDTVGAGFGDTAKALGTIGDVAIADDDRLRRQLIPQLHRLGNFLPASWHLAHFFRGPGMDGQRAQVLAQQKANPLFGLLLPEADTRLDADWQAGGFRRGDNFTGQLGVFNERRACAMFSNGPVRAAHVNVDGSVAHVPQAVRHLGKMFGISPPDLGYQWSFVRGKTQARLGAVLALWATKAIGVRKFCEIDVGRCGLGDDVAKYRVGHGFHGCEGKKWCWEVMPY